MSLVRLPTNFLLNGIGNNTSNIKLLKNRLLSRRLKEGDKGIRSTGIFLSSVSWKSVCINFLLVRVLYIVLYISGLRLSFLSFRKAAAFHRLTSLSRLNSLPKIWRNKQIAVLISPLSALQNTGHSVNLVLYSRFQGYICSKLCLEGIPVWFMIFCNESFHMQHSPIVCRNCKTSMIYCSLCGLIYHFMFYSELSIYETDLKFILMWTGHFTNPNLFRYLLNTKFARKWAYIYQTHTGQILTVSYMQRFKLPKTFLAPQ